MSELHDLTALETGAAIRRGETSPTDCVEHYLDRVARLDDRLGAFVTVTAESAHEQAREAETALRDTDDLPPLFGVPTAIKDLQATRGVVTKLGSAVFADWVPDYDDIVVTRMRAAGLISLGKTSVPELGLPCYTEPAIGPPARTPWDTGRLAGGSSGGAAAATAAGLVPVAQGSDGGGSVRIPASVCGLVGLKPTRGRVSRGPIDGDAMGLSVIGPLARTVRDAAAFLDVVAGPAPGDPSWAPPLPPQESFLAWCERPPGRLRIGRYLDSPIPHELDAQVRAAWDRTSALLESLGHDVVDTVAPLPPEAIGAFEIVWAVSPAGAPIPPPAEALLLPLTRYLRERGRAVTAADYARAIGALQTMSRRGIAASDEFDAVLTPTVAQLPRPVGWFTETGDPADDFERQKAFTPWTAIYNCTGQPAVSLPLETSAEGLPIGMMLVGRPAQEGPLLALGAQLEAAAPWAERHPPIWTA